MIRHARTTSRFRRAAGLIFAAGATIGLNATGMRADEPDWENSAALAAAFPGANEPMDEPMDDPADEPVAEPAAADPGAVQALTPSPAQDPAPAAGPKFDKRGRRIQSDDTTVLAFKNVSIDQIIPFVVEATGKVVQSQPDVMNRRITILNDQPISRDRALDMLFLAMFQGGIAVVETQDTVQLRDISEIDRMDVPVIGADE